MHDDRSLEHRAEVRLRLEGPIFNSIEAWRRLQPKIPSFAQAVRELLKRGLRDGDEQGGNAQGLQSHGGPAMTDAVSIASAVFGCTNRRAQCS
jgi:hypothetical protein